MLAVDTGEYSIGELMSNVHIIHTEGTNKQASYKIASLKIKNWWYMYLLLIGIAF